MIATTTEALAKIQAGWAMHFDAAKFFLVSADDESIRVVDDVAHSLIGSGAVKLIGEQHGVQVWAGNGEYVDNVA